MFIIVFTMILIVATMIYIIFTKIGNVMKRLKHACVNGDIIPIFLPQIYYQHDETRLYCFFRLRYRSCPKIIPEIRAIRGDQNNLTEAI